MKKLFASLALLAVAAPGWADDVRKSEPKTYRVPYRLTNTNHVLLRVKINGKGPYNFIVDTGAPALFVSTEVSRKLGVKPDRDGWGKFKRFEIEGGVVLEDFKGRVENPFQLEGMNGLGLAGAELHGIIGYTLLARYRLEFDFTKHKMGWTPLDYKPEQPLMGGHGAPAGLDAMGAIMKFVGVLMGKRPEQEIILRGFLGIGMEEKGEEVLVTAVLANSPAADSGIKIGDRIKTFQNKAVRSLAAVQKAATKLTADEPAKLEIERDGKMQTITIKAGKGI